MPDRGFTRVHVKKCTTAKTAAPDLKLITKLEWRNYVWNIISPPPPKSSLKK
jgi:hypothetical protein